MNPIEAQSHLEGLSLGFNDSYRFGAHAVIPDAEGRILLLHETYGDKAWGLPGGGVEPGETVHEAVRRECDEEIGVSVEVGPLTGLYYHRRVNAQVAIFRCTLPDGAVIRLSDEHSDYKWVRPSELPDTQRVRVEDALHYRGTVASRVF